MLWAHQADNLQFSIYSLDFIIFSTRDGSGKWYVLGINIQNPIINITRKELEDRLVNFSVLVFNLSKHIEKEYFSNYLINQLLRSSASAALNYGEAQSAETKKDFIHKIGVVLKELRESNVNLKIILKTGLIMDKSMVNGVLDESNQLVSIFYRTIQTAKKKQQNCTIAAIARSIRLNEVRPTSDIEYRAISSIGQ